MLRKATYILFMFLAVGIASLTASEDSSFKPFNRPPSVAADADLPLAFDFAFPISDAFGDDQQVFSFYMGVLR